VSLVGARKDSEPSIIEPSPPSQTATKLASNRWLLVAGSAGHDLTGPQTRQRYHPCAARGRPGAGANRRTPRVWRRFEAPHPSASPSMGRTSTRALLGPILSAEDTRPRARLADSQPRGADGKGEARRQARSASPRPNHTG
jgi:hypothetical protein